MRIEIDHERCTGHGRCYSLAPDLFDCDDEGYGRALLADVPDHLVDQARTAETTCPERAVRCLTGASDDGRPGTRAASGGCC